MTQSGDDLAGLMRDMDPLGADMPPARGSDRYHAIFTASVREPAQARARVARAPRWRMAVLAASFAAVVGLVGIGIVTDGLPWQPGALAAVRHALQHGQAVDSFTFRGQVVAADGDRITLSGRADGDDRQAELTRDPGGPGPDRRMSMTIVGDRVYTNADGRRTVRARLPGEQLFGPDLAVVSRAIMDALEAADVTRAGTESIAGSEATRYEVELSDRSLAAFSDPSLGFPSDLERLDIWIADDELRQIRMTAAGGDEVLYTFLDIGGDLPIAVPPGDFEADPVPIGFLFEPPTDDPR